MANAIIMTPTLSDNGSIESVGNELASAPASNLLKIQPTDIWQTDNLSNVFFTIDLGSSQTFDTVALLYTNASSSATWRIRTADTEQDLTEFPSTGHDSGSLTMWPDNDLSDWDRVHALYRPGFDITNRWLRIDVTDTSNTDGAFKAGRLYVAAAWQPAKNIRFGWSLGFEDPSRRFETSGGQTIIDPIDQKRTARFEFRFLSKNDMFNNGYEIARLRGGSADILAVLDPDEDTHLHKYIIYGVLEPRNQIINQVLDLYSQEYRLMELL